MRLFTGIEPSREVVNRLAPLLSRVNGVPAANLHITTKFIGAWPEARLRELTDALTKQQWPRAFTIRVAGLAGFAKTLYAEVHAGPELAELARRTEDTLAALGCARETRAYHPHLTLARRKHENIGELTPGDFGSFEATEFHLYLSEASVYTKLATWPLA